MVRRKIGDNQSELGNETVSDSKLVSGTNGDVSAEDLRDDKGTIGREEEGIFNPAELDASAEPGESSGEQWFPKRNKRSKKPRASKETASDLNVLLWLVHQGLSELTGVEEFALDPKESEELAKAIARVQAFYPSSVLSPLVMAWSGLVLTGGKIYGTRLIAYSAKKRKKKSGNLEVVEIPLPPNTATATEM